MSIVPVNYAYYVLDKASCCCLIFMNPSHDCTPPSKTQSVHICRTVTWGTLGLTDVIRDLLDGQQTAEARLPGVVAREALRGRHSHRLLLLVPGGNRAVVKPRSRSVRVNRAASALPAHPGRGRFRGAVVVGVSLPGGLQQSQDRHARRGRDSTCLGDLTALAPFRRIQREPTRSGRLI